MMCSQGSILHQVALAFVGLQAKDGFRKWLVGNYIIHLKTPSISCNAFAELQDAGKVTVGQVCGAPSIF